MQASLLRRSRPAQHPAASVDAAGPVDDRSPRCRRSVRAGAVLVLVVGVAVVLVVASGVRRRFDLTQELSDLRLDVLAEAPSETVVVLGERRHHLRRGLRLLRLLGTDRLLAALRLAVVDVVVLEI